MMIEQMKQEYDKGGKFKDFVDRACKQYGDSKEAEFDKATVKEYYKSVLHGGCNEDRR